jgi:hypothetical protein
MRYYILFYFLFSNLLCVEKEESVKDILKNIEVLLEDRSEDYKRELEAAKQNIELIEERLEDVLSRAEKPQVEKKSMKEECLDDCNIANRKCLATIYNSASAANECHKQYCDCKNDCGFSCI